MQRNQFTAMFKHNTPLISNEYSSLISVFCLSKLSNSSGTNINIISFLWQFLQNWIHLSIENSSHIIFCCNFMLGFSCSLSISLSLLLSCLPLLQIGNTLTLFYARHAGGWHFFRIICCHDWPGLYWAAGCVAALPSPVATPAAEMLH